METNLMARRTLLAGLAMSAVSGPTVPSASAQTPSLSLGDVLQVPDVTHVLGSDGQAAWVERIGGAENVLLRHANGRISQLTAFYADDGAAIRPLALFTDGRVLCVRSSGPETLPLQRTLLVAADGADAADVGSWLGETPDAAATSPDRRMLALAHGDTVSLADLTERTPPQPVFTDRGQIAALSWSPDGAKLAFVSDRRAAGRGDYGFVGVFDIRSQTITYLDPNIGFDINPVWSADSGRIAFIRHRRPQRAWRFTDLSEHAPFSVIVADATSGEGLLMWTAPLGRGQHFSGFWDGAEFDPTTLDSLFWMANGDLIFPWEQTGFRALYALSPEAATPRRLTVPNAEIAGAAQSPDRTQLVYWGRTGDDPDRLDLYRIRTSEDLQSQRLFETPTTGIRHGAMFLDNTSFVYRDASNRTPERLMISVEGTVGAQISTVASALARIESLMNEPEIVRFRSRDGTALHGVLYCSSQAPPRAPLIVHAHGGSRDQVYPAWQTFFGYPPVLRYLMTRGCHVLSVNYRSGIGYGLAFRETARYGAKGVGDVEDIIAAASFARTLPFVDPERIIVYGHSYGGGLAASALARSNVFAAGVVSAGISDWVHEMESDSGGPLPLSIPERAGIERAAYANSAISQIDRWGGEPVLFLHGDADRSAAMDQTIELYLALLNRGVDVEASVFLGEGHAMRLERDQRRYIIAIEHFLRRRSLIP